MSSDSVRLTARSSPPLVLYELGPVAPPPRVASCRTRLSCGTIALVTPPCHAFVACTPASLSLVFPGLCLPPRPRLPHLAFLASSGGSAPLLTPPRFTRRLLHCRLSTWTFVHLPDSPQQNEIAERRIGLVMEVARTSMIHAAAPHFLWPFAVRFAAQQLNLWPHVSLPETSPTLHWTGEVGNASVFRVWGSRAFVRDTSADKLSARAIPCVFLGFPPDEPSWQFYHPTSRRVFPSQDVTFDKSAHFYRLFPYRSAPPPPAPLFLAPGPPLVDPLPPQAVDLDAASRGAASRGAEPGGVQSKGAESRSAEPGGAEPGGAEPSLGVLSLGGAETRGTASSGGPAGALPRLSPWPEPLSPQQLQTLELEVLELLLELVVPEVLQVLVLEVLVPRVLELLGQVVLGALELETLWSLELLGLEALELEALALVALELEELELLTLKLEVLEELCGRDRPSFPCFSRFLTASHHASPVCTGRRVPRLRPPPIPSTYAMALRPSSVPLRVPLPPPPESSLPAVPDPEFECARAASPVVSCLLAAVVTDPSFESTTASALVAELVDFAAACRLDYATALVAKSESANPPSVGGECALDTDVLEDRQEDFECLAAAVPRFASMLLAPEGDLDAPDILTPRS
ncbi:unnamed protein product [Closterium sp. NIES-53]